MKITMNGVETAFQASLCFKAVKKAIEDNIKEGCHRYVTCDYKKYFVTVCKNKTSYTCDYLEPY